jgi:prepilin-type N-terminal cleavage/methylation domain-containing protein
MYRLARPPRRQGFTLIEILVVVAILAILVALVASGISKVKTSQMSRNTEGTVSKLQQALDSQWKAIVDQCKQDRLGKSSNSVVFAKNSTLMTLCNNDPDRTEALWAYLNLKRELPQSFAEALGDPCPNPAQLAGSTPFSSPDTRRGIWIWFPAVNSTAATLILQPRQTFASVAGASVTGVSPPNGATLAQGDAEAAVLLYLFLSAKGNKGVNYSADDATNGAQTSLGSFRVFADAWGTPISFARFANSTSFPELGSPPYVDSTALNAFNNAVASGTAPTVTVDPLDPIAKLFNWPNTNSAACSAGLSALNNSGVSTVTFGQAKQPTVASAGPDMVFNGPNGDDLFGYRYRRQANK